MTKPTRYILQNSRGVFFLREPKRRKQLRHRRKGLGILKPIKLVHLHVRTNFGDEIDIFFKYSYAHVPCSHSSFACTGTHYVCRLEKLVFLPKCRLFKISKLKSWNVHGSIFRMSTNPDRPKNQILGKKNPENPENSVISCISSYKLPINHTVACMLI